MPQAPAQQTQTTGDACKPLSGTCTWCNRQAQTIQVNSFFSKTRLRGPGRLNVSPGSRIGERFQDEAAKIGNKPLALRKEAVVTG